MAQHVQTTIRYDGPALAGHEMDVQDLAPALLALAEIAKIANHKFNGNQASIRVMVNADVEQQCFQLDLSLVQSWLDQAAMLMGKGNVATVRQIAEIIGLTAPPAGGLFWLYKRIYGKDAKDTQVTFTADDAKGVTIIQVIGNDNDVIVRNETIEVSNQTAILAQDARVVQHLKTVLEPLRKPDYEDFSVIDGGKPVVVIDREEAENIRYYAAPLPSEDEEGDFVSKVDGQVEIITAQFKGSAQWGLWWTGRTRLMKIEDTEWLWRFQHDLEPDVQPGAWLDIEMEIRQPRDRKLPASFIVKKVKRVLPPEPPQEGLSFDQSP